MRYEHEYAQDNSCSLLCFFVVLGGYAMIFKPRNDNFDEGAGQVLGIRSSMFAMVEFIIQWLAAPVAAFGWA